MFQNPANPMAHLLLVDNDTDFREALANQLRDEEYEVEIASSATQALEIASRRKLSLAILEVNLPGVDGVQLLRYFRSRHVFRQMPVIFLTGELRKESLNQVVQLGVRDIMLKANFKLTELVERIELRLTQPTDLIRDPQMAQDVRSVHNTQAILRSTVPDSPSNC